MIGASDSLRHLKPINTDKAKHSRLQRKTKTTTTHLNNQTTFKGFHCCLALWNSKRPNVKNNLNQFDV